MPGVPFAATVFPFKEVGLFLSGIHIPADKQSAEKKKH
jgi:hypothetical protein